MTNYRIRIDYDGFTTRYFPQRKFLGIWWDMFSWGGFCNGFVSYESANEAVCNCIKRKKTEYLDVKCGE